jgi:hypothetical protein
MNKAEAKCLSVAAILSNPFLTAEEKVDVLTEFMAEEINLAVEIGRDGIDE